MPPSVRRINIIAAELIFVAIFIAVVAAMWPFLAFDLVFRPPGPEDFD